MPNLRKVIGTVKAEIEAHNQVTATETTRRETQSDTSHASPPSAKIIKENNGTLPPIATTSAARSRRRVPQRLQRMNILIGAVKPKAQRAYSRIPMEGWDLDSYEPPALKPVHPVTWNYGKVIEFSMALPVPSDKDGCPEQASHDCGDNAITIIEYNGIPMGPLAQSMLRSALSANLKIEPQEGECEPLTTSIVRPPPPKPEFNDQPADRTGRREKSGWIRKTYQMLQQPLLILRWWSTSLRR